MSPPMVAALTIDLRVKKGTISEIAAAAPIMRKFATPILCRDTANLVDIIAGVGAHIAKHGGRSVSSYDSADVPGSFGANINLTPAKVAQSIEQTGNGFVFAPNHRETMKHT